MFSFSFLSFFTIVLFGCVVCALPQPQAQDMVTSVVVVPFTTTVHVGSILTQTETSVEYYYSEPPVLTTGDDDSSDTPNDGSVQTYSEPPVLPTGDADDDDEPLMKTLTVGDEFVSEAMNSVSESANILPTSTVASSASAERASATSSEGAVAASAVSTGGVEPNAAISISRRHGNGMLLSTILVVLGASAVL